MDRRNFIKAISGASVGILATPLLGKAEEITPEAPVTSSATPEVDMLCSEEGFCVPTIKGLPFGSHNQYQAAGHYIRVGNKVCFTSYITID